MKSITFLTIAVLALALGGCTQVKVDKDSPVQVRAYAVLFESTVAVKNAADQLKLYRDAGIIEAGSPEDDKIKVLLIQASDAVEDGWALYDAGNFELAELKGKTAKQIYFTIRPMLKKLETQ